MSEISPLRVVLKALVIFVVLNAAYAVMQPPVGRLSIYNRLVAGRLRLPTDQPAAAHNVSVNDLDALFASHVIADGTGTAAESRIVVLGDSQTWGWSEAPSTMLTEQLN